MGFLNLTECAHVHDTACVLAMVLPLFLYLHLVVIAAEEKLLSAEFGADYARVPRSASVVSFLVNAPWVTDGLPTDVLTYCINGSHCRKFPYDGQRP